MRQLIYIVLFQLCVRHPSALCPVLKGRAVNARYLPDLRQHYAVLNVEYFFEELHSRNVSHGVPSQYRAGNIHVVDLKVHIFLPP